MIQQIKTFFPYVFGISKKKIGTKIDIFRNALKEFVPDKTIQFKRRSGDLSENFELKMTCVDGALKYLRDKKYGFADITIKTKEPALPYRITAYTHNGDEVVLIHKLKRGSASGYLWYK